MRHTCWKAVSTVWCGCCGWHSRCGPGCPPSPPSLEAMGAGAAVVSASPSLQTHPIPEKEKKNCNFLTQGRMSYSPVAPDMLDSSELVHHTNVNKWFEGSFKYGNTVKILDSVVGGSFFFLRAVLWFEMFLLILTGVYFCVTGYWLAGISPWPQDLGLS